jgi:hypothetical protein
MNMIQRELEGLEALRRNFFAKIANFLSHEGPPPRRAGDSWFFFGPDANWQEMDPKTTITPKN